MASRRKRDLHDTPTELPEHPTPDPAEDDTVLSWESPESQFIQGASYDPSTRVLRVDFKSGDGRFFDGVEPEFWREFVQAVSKGKFFQSMIRPFRVGRRTV